MSNDKYKSLVDLANYLNSTEYFSNKWISVKKILETFEKVHLFKKDENGKYIPTEFMKNSNGCFVTKFGKILFTKQCWDLMTKDQKSYTKGDWLNWFISVFRQEGISPLKECRPEKHLYLANLDNGLIRIATGYSKKDICRRLAMKYHSYCVARRIKIGKKKEQ